MQHAGHFYNVISELPSPEFLFGYKLCSCKPIDAAISTSLLTAINRLNKISNGGGLLHYSIVRQGLEGMYTSSEYRPIASGPNS